MDKHRVVDESTVYLNGEYQPRCQAVLSVEDRGTLFADGVYEVTRYFNGRAFAMDDHLARLRRSLAGIRLAEPNDVAKLPAISDELIRRNRATNAVVYWQITRGPALRNPMFPASPRPSVLAMIYPLPDASPILAEMAAPASAMLMDDTRWAHCWIKSLMLLPNVLAKDEATQAGVNEAILHRNGVVTEATAANVMIVRGGEIWTYPTDGRILGGITRQHLLDLARDEGIVVREQTFTCNDLLVADEVCLTSTMRNVQPVLQVNGRQIGAGEIGPVTTRLACAFARHVQSAVE